LLRLHRLVTAALSGAVLPGENIMPDRLRYDCQSDTNDDAASENEFSAKVIHDDSPFRLILKSGLRFR
jgi:hypothetical protein